MKQTNTANIVSPEFYKKLENIPNLEAKISALQRTPNFADLGVALNIALAPTNSEPEPHEYKAEFCQFCGNKIDPEIIQCPTCQAILEKPETEPLDSPKMHILEIFAGSMTFIIWLTVTYAVLTSYPITLVSVAGVALFWVIFIGVFRTVAGGLIH